MAYKTLGNRNRKEPRRDCKLNDGGVTEKKSNKSNICTANFNKIIILHFNMYNRMSTMKPK